MNHHDVVEAGGNWKTDPFSGAVKEGRIWGRGTLDDKGGLWAMLQAAEEMIEEGFVPGWGHLVFFILHGRDDGQRRGGDRPLV